MYSKSCGEKRLSMISNDYNTKETGIRVNSFYDVFPEERSEEEIREYKRLIGMPLSEDYEELISSLK